LIRDELISAANREGIRRSSYSLEGGLPPEKYVLAEENGHWVVYYSERGERRDQLTFDNEQDACDQLFLWLVEDRTTRTREEYAGDPARISDALVVWTGYGQMSWPQRDEERLARQVGPLAAADLLPIVRRLADEFYATNARYVAHDLIEMGELAAQDFKQRHPEITAAAIEALAWCYTFDYK
jgi:hypothetical protein